MLLVIACELGVRRLQDVQFIGFIYSGPIEMNDYVKPFFAEGSTPKTIPFGSSSMRIPAPPLPSFFLPHNDFIPSSSLLTRQLVNAHG